MVNLSRLSVALIGRSDRLSPGRWSGLRLGSACSRNQWGSHTHIPEVPPKGPVPALRGLDGLCSRVKQLGGVCPGTMWMWMAAGSGAGWEQPSGA